MDFCKVCGNILRRLEDGRTECRNGHSFSDDLTFLIQERKREGLKEILEKKLTFPDIKKQNVSVLRLVCPYKFSHTSKVFREENTPTFDFYNFLSKLEEEYPPKLFRRIKGDIFAKGSIQNKFGIILCSSVILDEIKEKIEEYDLRDGKHFVLETIKISLEKLERLVSGERKKVLEEFSQEEKPREEK